MNKRQFCVTLLCLISLITQAQRVRISGTVAGQPADWSKLTMRVWETAYTAGIQQHVPYRVINSTITDGRFSFTIDDVKDIVFFSIGYKKPDSDNFFPFVELYPAEPSDDLQVDLGRIHSDTFKVEDLIAPLIRYYTTQVSWAGKGVAKLRVLNAFEREAFRRDSIRRTQPAILVGPNNAISVSEATLPEYESRMKTMLASVDAVSQGLNRKMADLLRAIAMGRNLSIYYGMLTGNLSVLKYYSPSTYEKDREKMKALYEKIDKGPAIAESIGALVPDFLQMTMAKANLLRALLQDEPAVYGQIKKNYSGLLRDKLICNYFLENGRNLPNIKELLDDALGFVKTASCLDLLNNTVRTSTPGMPAYAFALPDANGKVIRLADLKGKVVFIDFWYTGCGACSKFYLTVLHEVEKTFAGREDIVFLTISIDSTKEQWLKSLKEGRYTSTDAPNVINLYTDGQAAEHEIIKWYKIRGYPQQILIGKDGKIIRATSLQLPVDPLISIIKGALGTAG